MTQDPQAVVDALASQAWEERMEAFAGRFGGSAPAVFAEASRPGLSPRYGFVSTATLVDMFILAGWQVRRAFQTFPRIRDRIPYAKHVVELANPALPKLTDGAEPRLLLLNSHNGETSLRTMFGVFRLVCTNGLIVAASSMLGAAIRHTSNAASIAHAHTESMAAAIPMVAHRIEQMRTRHLSYDERHRFAVEALALRFGTGARVGPTDVLAPRREEDRGHDAWTVFNVVQENLVRGGVQYRLPRVGGPVRSMTTRALRSVSSLVPFNRDLWALAERFAEVETVEEIGASLSEQQ